MDVYLIPVAGAYELYSEQPPDQPAIAVEPESKRGRVGKLIDQFKAAVAEAELQQQGGIPVEEPKGWIERIRRRTMRWIAERIAEWRLLWRIRKEADVCLIYPDDLSDDQAMTITRRMLKGESHRHVKWTVIDGLLFCASGIVAPVPGPNPFAYYFGFRFVGHLLCWRGAKHALEKVRWTCDPTPHLSNLRSAVLLPVSERDRRVQDVAAALHLDHLPTFFERTAAPTA